MVASNTSDPVFSLPATLDSVMYQPVVKVLIEDLTNGVITGPGAFDKIMASVKTHLAAEYENGRITGNEYTKAYIEMTTAALQTALQFIMGRDAAFWTAQKGQVDAITARVALESAKYSYDNLLPAQWNLLKEQANVQHAQISDTLSDGTVITGVVGAQKDLYKQQITSYKRDAEVKAARIFTDAWITQKTIDDGLTAPPNFTNSVVDEVLGVIKANNNF